MIGEYSEIKNMPNTFACKFVAGLNGDLRVELADKFLNKQVISVFKDEELKNSIDAFFANNLNISETSRNSYMHRNTLLYRLDKIHKITGLNIRNFDDAVTLQIMEILYETTKNLRQ
ncbi:MAG: helix-turn-helix domain-containing protein [Clostridia bacterium]|nr:helix-turn-helix domain-containing protein [Clostridia bacterium]